jgi:hypothetical protein
MVALGIPGLPRNGERGGLERNRHLAAAASRDADSRKSIVAPVESMALDSNICLINAPGFVGGIELPAQPLVHLGTVTLHPTPDRRMIRCQPALGANSPSTSRSESE